MSIRALIVDDEPIARHSVARLLREEADIAVIGEFGDGASALEAIRRLKPDLVFLDIQMPELTGIDVAASLGEEDLPATVFVTAYEQYAVRAFEANAVDYLVKPFSRERFDAMLRRARRRLAGEGGQAPAQVWQALAELRREQGYARRLPVPLDGSVILLDVGRIDWIEASRNRARLHVGRDIYELRETMASLEQRLNPRHFARVHRSAIVNIERIRAIHPWFKGYHLVVLTTGQELRMSRYQHETFRGLARLQERTP